LKAGSLESSSAVAVVAEAAVDPERLDRGGLTTGAVVISGEALRLFAAGRLLDHWASLSAAIWASERRVSAS